MKKIVVLHCGNSDSNRFLRKFCILSNIALRDWQSNLWTVRDTTHPKSMALSQGKEMNTAEGVCFPRLFPDPIWNVRHSITLGSSTGILTYLLSPQHCSSTDWTCDFRINKFHHFPEALLSWHVPCNSSVGSMPTNLQILTDFCLWWLELVIKLNKERSLFAC